MTINTTVYPGMHNRSVSLANQSLNLNTYLISHIYLFKKINKFTANFVFIQFNRTFDSKFNFIKKN